MIYEDTWSVNEGKGWAPDQEKREYRVDNTGDNSVDNTGYLFVYSIV